MPPVPDTADRCVEHPAAEAAMSWRPAVARPRWPRLHPDRCSRVAFGLAVVGAAFMLAWGAEVIQLDISAGLALALLALIAVLPEYAVDFVFTWKAGKDPAQYAPDALANMTGGNQLLIGVGWSMVVLVAAYRIRAARAARAATLPAERRPDDHRRRARTLALGRDRVPRDRDAVRAHAAAASTLTLFDAAVLVTIFVVYIVRIARAPAEEPHLVGPARS